MAWPPATPLRARRSRSHGADDARPHHHHGLNSPKHPLATIPPPPRRRRHCQRALRLPSKAERQLDDNAGPTTHPFHAGYQSPKACPLVLSRHSSRSPSFSLPPRPFHQGQRAVIRSLRFRVQGAQIQILSTAHVTLSDNHLTTGPHPSDSYTYYHPDVAHTFVIRDSTFKESQL